MVTLDEETGHGKINELPGGGGHRTELLEPHLLYWDVLLALVKKCYHCIHTCPLVLSCPQHQVSLQHRKGSTRASSGLSVVR